MTDEAGGRPSGSLMRFESRPPATALDSSTWLFARKVKARARRTREARGLNGMDDRLEGWFQHSYPIFLTDRGRLVRRIASGIDGESRT